MNALASRANKPATKPGQESNVDDAPEVPVNTLNEFAISTGKNLGNHTESIAGRGTWVRQMVPTVPLFRTKQQSYRYAAYLLTMTDNVIREDGGIGLPDEEGAHTFEQVLHAIQNA